jgi:outer membrane protein OmpA-like peptidoglycan-associated protein
MKFISKALLTVLISGTLVASFGCATKTAPEPIQYRSSGKSERIAPADAPEEITLRREEPPSEESLRLIEELRQRGIDVRESERGVVINLPDVLFASGRAELTATAQGIISEIAQIIQRAPSRSLAVEGHTDSVGTIEYNYHLSKSRAEQVAKALENNKIQPNLISITAFGETTPIATNRTDLGRRQNRRVEIIIVKEGQQNLDRS